MKGGRSNERNCTDSGWKLFYWKKVASNLCEAGYQVSILNRGTNPCPSDQIEQICCDRNNLDEMKRALTNREFDYIIDVSWKDLSWVKNLCNALCFQTVKKFVFLSSSAVYDIDHLTIPFHEEDSLKENPYWKDYGFGKIQAEQYYQEFFQSKETQLIIIRPPYVYGENNYAQRESFIFHHLCNELEIIIPRSNPRLQFIYSGDLANIIQYLLEHNQEKFILYNVGNKKTITAREWILLCAEIVKKNAKIIECDYHNLGRGIRDFFPFFDYDNVLDVNKIHQIFPNEITMRDGLKTAYQWYQEVKDQLQLKETVEQNIQEMILELNR